MKYLAITSVGDGGGGAVGSGSNIIHIGNLSSNGIPTGGLDKVADIIQTLIALAFLFAVILGLFLLIYSGFMWITSAGDKQKLQQARQRLVYVIVGLAIVFLSLLIINLLGNFFGVGDLLKLPGS